MRDITLGLFSQKWVVVESQGLVWQKMQEPLTSDSFSQEYSYKMLNFHIFLIITEKPHRWPIHFIILLFISLVYHNALYPFLSILNIMFLIVGSQGSVNLLPNQAWDASSAAQTWFGSSKTQGPLTQGILGSEGLNRKTSSWQLWTCRTDWLTWQETLCRPRETMALISGKLHWFN